MTTKINLLPLMAQHQFRICEPFSAPSTVETRIDAIWAKEKAKRGDRLTNGSIYSLLEHRADCLTVQPAQYRHVLARRRAPDLIEAGLAVRPLAVTGVLLCADGLVLGRRGDEVASDAGLWEPAPAGGLSQPDPRAQLLQELEEELGLAPSRVISSEACGLVEDVESGVFDIVFRLRVAGSGEDIQATYKALGSKEYAELAVIKPMNVPAFLKTHHDHLLPALEPMLRLAGLL